MLRMTFPVGALQCNCCILGDLERGEAVVIDPGDEADRILMELAKHKLKVSAIVHTHAHIDHMGGSAQLAEATQAPTYLHPADNFLQQILPQQAAFVGLPEPAKGSIDLELADEAAIRFGRYELGVLHTPGHSPGSVCFTVPGQDLCLSGDTLFADGIGRTDLWGGDFATLERSIHDRLYGLNGAVEVIPGHGPKTSIDRERVSNPFVRARK